MKYIWTSGEAKKEDQLQLENLWRMAMMTCSCEQSILLVYINGSWRIFHQENLEEPSCKKFQVAMDRLMERYHSPIVLSEPDDLHDLGVEEAVFFPIDGKPIRGAFVAIGKLGMTSSSLAMMNLIVLEISEKLAVLNKYDLKFYLNWQFDNFFEKSIGMICAHDLEGKLLSVNSASARNLGYEVEEIIGKSLFDLIPKHHHPYLHQILIDIQKDKISKGTMKIRHKDGSSRIWVYNNLLQESPDGQEYVLGNALDITDRYRLEIEHERLKEMLEQTNKAARVGGWEVDMVNNKIFWTDITYEIYGLDRSFTPTIENSINFFKPGKSRKRIELAFDTALKFGKKYDLELELITAQGKEIWIRVVAIPEFKKGKCVRVYGAFQDITDRKTAEMEIVQTNRLLANVQKASTEISIVATGTDGIITVFNSGAEKILGYNAEDVIGKVNPSIFHVPEELEQRSKELSARFKREIKGMEIFTVVPETDGAELREWNFIRKKGEIIPVSLAVTAMRDDWGDVIGYLGIALNISERKAAENLLEDERARLSAFVKHAPAAVAMFDEEVRYIALSDRWKEEYRLEGEELLGKSHYEVFKNISPRWKTIHQRALKGEVISKSEEVWRPPGWEADQYLRWEVRPWHKHDGTIGGIMMLTQDITESCLQREKLKAAIVVAEEASSSKSEFLANMSHEIRTPLNGVIGFTDLVLKTDLTETQNQYLSIVHQSANVLLNIISDILDFSKIEAGKLELDIDKCDLYELTNQASDIITYDVHKKGLEMLLNIQSGIPRFIWVDSVRLKQVLVNLLGNATKFTQQGEIELKVEILSEIKELGQMRLRFSVRDTGIGIKPSKQAKIFEAFSQEDIGTTKKYGGTGLGLTISNSLLQLMDSQLALESVPEEGSTFYFDLTVQCEDGFPVDVEEVLGIDSVLIVDDNANNRLILEQMLSLKDIASAQAKDGIEALQLLKEGSVYDVILMDYNMPYLNGIETIRKIRENFDYQPIIFLHSSSDDEVIRKACRELDVRLRLVKPIKIQEMYRALQRVKQQEEMDVSSILPAKAESPRSVLAPGTKVMIVEDNEINLLLAKTVVADLAAEAIILEARNGLEAVEIFKKECPSLIFMDVQMPVMNGYKATEKIRELTDLPQPIILALTAGNVKGEREKTRESGMNDFISKPFVESDLITLLKKWQLFTEPKLPAKTVDIPELKFEIEKFTAFLGLYQSDQKVIKDLLNSGLREMKHSKIELSKMMDKKAGDIILASHRLYGSASTLQMDSLADLALQIEHLEVFDFTNESHVQKMNQMVRLLDLGIASLAAYIASIDKE